MEAKQELDELDRQRGRELAIVLKIATERDEARAELTIAGAREQSRLARCAAESRRLSLEECCYWLLLSGVFWIDMVRYVSERKGAHISAEAKYYARSARDPMKSLSKEERRFVRRQYLTVAWLCREALRRIEEERRD
jgi:hypothetical protein